MITFFSPLDQFISISLVDIFFFINFSLNSMLASFILIIIFLFPRLSIKVWVVSSYFTLSFFLFCAVFYMDWFSLSPFLLFFSFMLFVVYEIKLFFGMKWKRKNLSKVVYGIIPGATKTDIVKITETNESNSITKIMEPDSMGSLVIAPTEPVPIIKAIETDSIISLVTNYGVISVELIGAVSLVYLCYKLYKHFTDPSDPSDNSSTELPKEANDLPLDVAKKAVDSNVDISKEVDVTSTIPNLGDVNVFNAKIAEKYTDLTTKLNSFLDTLRTIKRDTILHDNIPWVTQHPEAQHHAVIDLYYRAFKLQDSFREFIYTFNDFILNSGLEDPHRLTFHINHDFRDAINNLPIVVDRVLANDREVAGWLDLVKYPNDNGHVFLTRYCSDLSEDVLKGIKYCDKMLEYQHNAVQSVQSVDSILQPYTKIITDYDSFNLLMDITIWIMNS